MGFQSLYLIDEGADDQVQISLQQPLSKYIVHPNRKCQCHIGSEAQQRRCELWQQVFGHRDCTAQSNISYQTIGEVAYLTARLINAVP
ncbi:hypothetical protein D9M68_635940 [compost metagenome]